MQWCVLCEGASSYGTVHPVQGSVLDEGTSNSPAFAGP